MYPKILFFLLPLALLFASVIAIFFWDRTSRDNHPPGPGNGKPEGAFRAFYHVLWMLLLWSGLAYSLPFWFSYKEKIESLPLPDRWVIAGKILVFPLILLALLGYGARRGYLKWIDGLDWPDKENQ